MSDTNFHFTLRFDDAEHSLTNYEGLPLGEVADLLKMLSEMITNDKSLVLSEVKGNCYALQITSKQKTSIAQLQVVHKSISDNDWDGLANKEYEYAKKLKGVMTKHKCKADAYDEKKEWKVRIEQIILPESPKYYYEVGSMYGIIIGIGSKDLEGKTTIQISAEGKKIEINTQQEQALLPFYKKQRITFYVRKKINVKTDEVESILLDDFEISDTADTFLNSLATIAQNLPDTLFNDIPDSAAAIRALRSE